MTMRCIDPRHIKIITPRFKISKKNRVLYNLKSRLIRVKIQFVYVVMHGETDANLNKQVNDKNMNTNLNATGKYFKPKRCLRSYPKMSARHIRHPSILEVQTAELIRHLFSSSVMYLLRFSTNLIYVYNSWWNVSCT